MTAHQNTIFVVDDTPANLKVLFEYLKEAGFEVLMATQAEDALEAISQTPPDLILLDILMPEIDGFETCRRLKADEATRDIPIIFMTALDDTVDEVKGLKLGAVDYITKPFQVQTVLARIRTHLALWDMQKELEEKNAQLHQENIERKQAEADLEEERALLAQRVKERTAELSKANAELARAARLKDEFLAAMSHELRTPLNAILGSAEILRDEIFGSLNDKQLKYSRNIDESGHHLLELINDILDLSKIEAGKMELDLGSVSVKSTCEASLRLVKQLAHKKQLQLSLKIEDSVTTLMDDERRLKQILVNLLSNAIKFTPEGGQIGLDVQGHGDQQLVQFIVWDTGIGVPQ